MEHKPGKFFDHAKSRTLSIVSAPFNGGQPRLGTELGPTSILNPEFIEQFRSLSWEVEVHPDLKFSSLELIDGVSNGKAKNCKLVGRVNKMLHEALFAKTQRRSSCLTLGGDHSLAIGSISAIARYYGPNLGVIWVDAHADINTPIVSESGNMHGMPVSFLLGLPGTENVPGFEWLYSLRQPGKMNDIFKDILPYACIRPGRVVYIGLRDLDQAEKEILKRYNILAFSMHEIDKYGISTVMEKTMSYLGTEHPIHLSFDVDGMDPSVSPSTGTPVMGGLTFREGRYICEVVSRSEQLVAMDLMEVNPVLGKADVQDATCGDGDLEKQLLHQEAINTIRAARAVAFAAFGRTFL